MEHYLRKLQHMHHQGHGDGARSFRKLKKLLIIVAVVGVLGFIVVTVLAVMAISWLFNRGGDELKQAGETVTQQVVPEVPSLNLASYITDGQVQTEQLTQTFNALPS